MIFFNNISSSCSRRAAAPFAVLTTLAGLFLAIGLRAPLQQAKSFAPAFVLNDEQQEQLNQSPFALILGEVRSSMADLMWIKTERYVHRGVAYEPHIDADSMARTGETKETAAASKSPAAEHEAEQAIVPAADKDYRGFIGEIQRRVQPWQGGDQPHEHQPGEELLPWYRMLTLSNPQHWRGYMIGAWWLSQQGAKAPGADAEALSFLEEGIRNNPEIFQLRTLHGRLLLAHGKAEEALKDFRASIALADKIRPEGGKPNPPIWSDSDEEDFVTAVRYVPLTLWRQLNNPQEARASVDRALTLLPNDKPLQDLKHKLETGD